MLQKLPCFVSSHDIEAGTSWMNALFANLEKSRIGIICLTRNALAKPWILFEAGALAKHMAESRVCPLLIDLPPQDVEFPLAAFQVKSTSKDDMLGLVTMINRAREGEPLTDAELTEVFDVRWPEFLNKLTAITSKSEHGDPGPSPRSMNEILNEILSLTRGLAARESASPVKLPVDTSTGSDWNKEALKVCFSSPRAEQIYSALLDGVHAERPLVSGWLDDMHTVRYDNENNHLFLVLPSSEAATEASLNRPPTKKFLEQLAQKLFGGKVSVVLQRP